MRHLVLATLMVGCGSYGSAYDASLTLAEVRCDRAFACKSAFPEEAPVPFDTLYGGSTEACVGLIGPDPGRQDTWKNAEDDDVIVYDKSAAKSCADTLEATACDAWWAEADPGSCASVLAGTLEAGAACRIDATCASGWCLDGACADGPTE